MSITQCIIGGSAILAAFFSNVPLVTAIGAFGPLNPTEDYPPQDGTSWFSLETNQAHCTYQKYRSNGVMTSYATGHGKNQQFLIHIFRSYTPAGTGRDPLRVMNPSVTYNDMWRLKSAVAQMGSVTDLREDDEKARQTEAGRLAISQLQKVCAVVIKAVMQKLGPFGDLCADYFAESDGAVATAYESPDWKTQIISPRVIDVTPRR
ncbi:hypothetical protein FOZ63_030024, partial [Perkinsus olseni]